MSKKTLVIGAVENPDRYAYKAAVSLVNHGHQIELFGSRKGTIKGVSIQTEFPEKIDNLDSVTLYLNPTNQQGYYDKILALQPKRVIFNPGTENPEFEEKLEKAGIQAEEACTLVLLSIGNY